MLQPAKRRARLSTMVTIESKVAWLATSSVWFSIGTDKPHNNISLEKTETGT
jgi:hypothetical protein